MIDFASLVRILEGIAIGLTILGLMAGLMSHRSSRKSKGYVQTLSYRGVTKPPVLAGLSATTKPADLLNLARFAEGRLSSSPSTLTGEETGAAGAAPSSARNSSS